MHFEGKMAKEKKKLLGRKGVKLLLVTTFLACLAPLAVMESLRTGVWIGVLAAAISSGIAFSLLSIALERSFKILTMALIVGVLLRIILVAVGLIVSLRLNAHPLAFCVAFFVLYIAHQSIEITSILRRSSPVAGGDA